MAGLIVMELKGYWLIIHVHDHGLWLGSVDVPESNQGDLRCQHAIDISS